MVFGLFGENLWFLNEKSDTWHPIQFCSLERGNNKKIVGKLQPFFLGTSEFKEMRGIKKIT